MFLSGVLFRHYGARNPQRVINIAARLAMTPSHLHRAINKAAALVAARATARAAIAASARSARPSAVATTRSTITPRASSPVSTAAFAASLATSTAAFAALAAGRSGSGVSARAFAVIASGNADRTLMARGRGGRITANSTLPARGRAFAVCRRSRRGACRRPRIAARADANAHASRPHAVVALAIVTRRNTIGCLSHRLPESGDRGSRGGCVGSVRRMPVRRGVAYRCGIAANTVSDTSLSVRRGHCGNAGGYGGHIAESGRVVAGRRTSGRV